MQPALAIVIKVLATQLVFNATAQRLRPGTPAPLVSVLGIERKASTSTLAATLTSPLISPSTAGSIAEFKRHPNDTTATILFARLEGASSDDARMIKEALLEGVKTHPEVRELVLSVDELFAKESRFAEEVEFFEPIFAGTGRKDPNVALVLAFAHDGIDGHEAKAIDYARVAAKYSDDPMHEIVLGSYLKQTPEHAREAVDAYTRAQAKLEKVDASATDPMSHWRNVLSIERGLAGAHLAAGDLVNARKALAAAEAKLAALRMEAEASASLQVPLTRIVEKNEEKLAELRVKLSE